MSGIDLVSEALQSATVTSFYNIMVNEVQSEQQSKMEGLTKRLRQSEAEKVDLQESTTKVIESLTVLNMEREGEFSTLQHSLKDQIKVKTKELENQNDTGNMNRSFSFAFKGMKKDKKSKKLN
jgi:hypothetical protein